MDEENRKIIKSKQDAIKKYNGKIVFKYKAIKTCEDFHRLEQIIVNNEIYVPTVEQVNDPFEGLALKNVATFAGSWTQYATGKMYDLSFSAIKTRRILSFSEECCNELMWAHYCQNYEGVCIAFKANGVSAQLNKVVYYGREDVVHISTINKKDSERIITTSLFYKPQKWKYEKEIRCISNDEKIKIEEKSVFAIIIGPNIDVVFKQAIIKLATDNNISIYELLIDQMNLQLYVAPWGFDREENLDGKVLKERINIYSDERPKLNADGKYLA